MLSQKKPNAYRRAGGAPGASICRTSDWATCYHLPPGAAARHPPHPALLPVLPPSSAPGAAARIIALLCAAPAPSSAPGTAAILPATALGAAARAAALLRPRCSSSLGPLDPSPEKAEERRCWIEERERERMDRRSRGERNRRRGRGSFSDGSDSNSLREE